MTNETNANTHAVVSERLAFADKAQEFIARLLDALGYREQSRERDAMTLLGHALAWLAFLTAYRADRDGIAASLWANSAERLLSVRGDGVWIREEIPAHADAIVSAFVQRFPPTNQRTEDAPDEADDLRATVATLAHVLQCTSEQPIEVRARAIMHENESLRASVRETLAAQNQAEAEVAALRERAERAERERDDAREAHRLALADIGALSDEVRRAHEKAEACREWLADIRAITDPTSTLSVVDLVKLLLVEHNAAKLAVVELRGDLAAVASDSDAARDKLAPLLDIAPDACPLSDMCDRITDAMATGQRARVIRAEQDAANLRAELNSVRRELATVREQSDAALRPLPTPDHVEPGQRWMLTVVPSANYDGTRDVRFGDDAGASLLDSDVRKYGVYLGMAPVTED